MHCFAIVGFLALFSGLGRCQDSDTEISVDGSCGSNGNETCVGSTFGGCCSVRGFCGKTAAYCSTGCQDAFSDSCQSVNETTSTTGDCGEEAGLVCTGSVWGDCCSANGFCGKNETYCGSGCQNEFGSCDEAETESSSASTRSSPTSISTSTQSSAAASTDSGSSQVPTPTFAAPAPVEDDSTPVTETTGFKAGIAVMAVVIGIILIALAFFLIRRRKQRNPPPLPEKDHQYVAEAPGAYAANRSPMSAELPAYSNAQEMPVSDEDMGRIPPTMGEQQFPGYKPVKHGY